MNSCEFYQELISRMLDDELSNNERSVLAEHLYMCDECAAMYSAFSMVSDMVATDLVEPPEELSEDVMAHIRRAEIRKRNRRNTRATKNAIVAAACVAFVVASVGGIAVVRNHRSDNVVYESRMSQSTAASSAKDGSYDTVIVSETPAVQNSQTQYVAPVEKYVSSTPQQQEEKPSLFASILPDSWFSAATPAPTQPPVIYATPVATPYMQNVTVPGTNSAVQNNMPAVVVVSPAVTENAMVVVTPAPTEAPVEILPAVTETPAIETPFVEAQPLVTEAPLAELPAVTEAPVTESSVITESPIAEVPAVPEAPVEETLPAVTEAPMIEVPATGAPVIEAPVATELPVFEPPFVNEAPVEDVPVVTEAPVPEISVEEIPMEEQFAVSSEITEALPAEQDSFSAQLPEDSVSVPVTASYDFSLKDCTEFVEAVFTPKKTEEAVPVQDAAAEAESEAATYVSVVDKLLAVRSVELCSLPENLEPQRIETLSFALEGQMFTVQMNFFGEDIYVRCSTGDGNTVSFMTAMSPAEYESFIALCYIFDGNM